MKSHTDNPERKDLLIGKIIAGILCVPLLICFIVNLAVGHTLNWFFIVLTSLMVAASLTVVPLAVKKKKGLFTIFSFTVSLLILLFTCSVFTRGKWFLTAGTSVVFGLSVLFTPYIAFKLPLPDFWKKNKGLFTFIIDTFLFAVMMFCIGVHLDNAEPYWEIMPPIALFNVGAVWIVFLVCRYLKASKIIRTGIASLITGGYLFTVNGYINMILGQDFAFPELNLSVWNTDAVNGNISWLILLVSLLIGFSCIIIGLVRRIKNK